MPHGSVNFHGVHSRPIPKGISLTGGRLLLRPHRQNDGAPVDYFLTAVHTHTKEMLEPLARGDLALCYNVIGSYAMAAAQRDPRIGVHFLSDYTLVMSRSAFILKTSRHKSEAIEFMKFLLSKEGQSSIARNSSLIPIDLSGVPEDSPLKGFDTNRLSFIPIKLGTGLLAYLDTVKKRNFLHDWESAMALPPLPN